MEFNFGFNTEMSSREMNEKCKNYNIFLKKAIGRKKIINNLDIIHIFFIHQEHLSFSFR